MNKVIVGLQSGDEAKGKITDALAKDATHVIRFNGANNAGHTVYAEDTKFKFHSLPSGILHPNCTNIIAAGCNVNPLELAEEIKALGDRKFNLLIDSKCHMIFPHHADVDRREEEERDEKIGTTCKGIGPSFSDKFRRNGVRLETLYTSDFYKKYHINMWDNEESGDENNGFMHDLSVAALQKAGEVLKPYVRSDVHMRIARASSNPDTLMLFEGAQGYQLDIDYGSYPNVSSSHPTSAGACLGTGLAPNKVDAVLGVIKAYTSKVGSGPFPTEMDKAMGDKIRELGNEYGTTTGRPRRIGWLNLVELDEAVKVNGVTEIALTLVDVLDTVDSIKVLTHTGYVECVGWKSETSSIDSFGSLPLRCRNYINFISNYLDVPVKYVSVGPGRDKLIYV